MKRQAEIIVLTDSSDESEDAAPSLLRPQLPPSTAKAQGEAPTVAVAVVVLRFLGVDAVVGAAERTDRCARSRDSDPTQRLRQARSYRRRRRQEAVDCHNGVAPRALSLLHGDGEDNDDDDDDDDDDEYRDGDASFGDGSRAFDRPRGARSRRGSENGLQPRRRPGDNVSHHHQKKKKKRKKT
ncbi:hypothetical protein PINS_up020187 [Pythium insidiosum]|nr:hypothetical protein PINS_up020187 [Pythium insidiosum]